MLADVPADAKLAKAVEALRLARAQIARMTPFNVPQDSKDEAISKAVGEIGDEADSVRKRINETLAELDSAPHELERIKVGENKRETELAVALWALRRIKLACDGPAYKIARDALAAIEGGEK